MSLRRASLLLAAAAAAAALALVQAGAELQCAEADAFDCRACEAGADRPSCAATGHDALVECFEADEAGVVLSSRRSRVSCRPAEVVPGLSGPAAFWAFQAACAASVTAAVLVMRRRKVAHYEAHERRIARMIASGGGGGGGGG